MSLIFPGSQKEAKHYQKMVRVMTAVVGCPERVEQPTLLVSHMQSPACCYRDHICFTKAQINALWMLGNTLQSQTSREYSNST